MSILNSLIGILFPPRCAICGIPTSHEAGIICPTCQAELPLTYDWLHHENELSERIWTLDPRINEVAALMRYAKGFKWRKIIIALKYNSLPGYGRIMGRFMGRHLSASKHFSDIDIVVPVPLHPFRHMARGYNQSEYIATGVAESLGCKMVANALSRRRYNTSQTKLSRRKRWENTENIFSVRKANALSGRHILLVDDVLTTGSTIVSLASTILDQVENVRVSIAVLGFVRHPPRRELLAEKSES